MGEQVLEPEVDFYGLCLQDADLSVVPNPYPAGRVMEGFVHARPDGWTSRALHTPTPRS
ncbi:hypothetical protein SAMN05428939_7938 [Streptomyces sp. TLI_105]|nr:hypothetical protein SAMN05428939_7938 [Streptomyces sp. TLI_105]